MNTSKKRPGTFAALILSLMLTACAAGRHPIQKNNSVLPAAGTKQTTLTLVLQANWAPDSSVRFSIYNDIWNEGRIAQRTSKNRENTGFIVYFASEAGSKMDSLFMSHPLKERVETSTASTTGELFIREEAYTEVRVNYTPELKRLILTDIETGKQQSLEIR